MQQVRVLYGLSFAFIYLSLSNLHQSRQYAATILIRQSQQGGAVVAAVSMGVGHGFSSASNRFQHSALFSKWAQWLNVRPRLRQHSSQSGLRL